MHDLGLLGYDTTYIHCTDSTDEELDLIAETGGTASVAPYVEMLMGHGPPPTGKLVERGVRPSLSVDVVSSVPGEMFTQMRTALVHERIGCVHGHAGRGVRAEAVAQGRAGVRDDRGRPRMRARGQGRLARAEEAGGHRALERRRDQHRADGRPGRHDRGLRRHVERRLRVRRRACSQAATDSSSTSS